MITDNPVLLRKYTPLPTLMCAQRRAEKRVSTEEDFIKSNIESFGNDIGRITNYITSMFEVRAGFEKGSIEYETLTYRIKCGQQLQQDSIDKAKGIIAKPMPRYWYDKHAIAKLEDENQRKLCYSIVADKKPYFMRYIYPALMKQYNTYIKNSEKSCMCDFGMTITELSQTPEDELSEQQAQFLYFHKKGVPVGTNDCVMNKICKRFEDEFDGFVGKTSSALNFDYSFMKYDASYSSSQIKEIERLRDIYSRSLASHCSSTQVERHNTDESLAKFILTSEQFKTRCLEVCSSGDILCDLLIDVCYSKTCTKKFAWSICGEDIIRRLLSSNQGLISFPEKDSDGDIWYGGERYALRTVKLGVEE